MVIIIYDRASRTIISAYHISQTDGMKVVFLSALYISVVFGVIDIQPSPYQKILCRCMTRVVTYGMSS
jgi:hypothetical protein